MKALPAIGSTWLWEPLKPHAFARLMVTNVRSAAGDVFIEAEDLSTRGRFWNELDRWEEAAVQVADPTPLGKYMAIGPVPLPPERKTREWLVFDRHGGVLGKVAWYGRWRQYTFEASAGSVFNTGCLSDIERFLSEQNESQRVAR